MKQNIQTLMLLAALVATSCSSILPGNDPVVVNAERTTQLALETFDGFVSWEYTNREQLARFPQIRELADRIRLEAPLWLMSARALTKAYKQNRTDEGKANLETIVSVLTAAVNEASTYLSAVPQLVGGLVKPPKAN